MKKVFKSAVAMSLMAMLIGAVLGELLGKDAGSLSLIAWLPLTLIKGLATPLLFLAITSGLMDHQVTGRGVRYLLLVCVVNTLTAVTIAIFIVNVFEPGRALEGLVSGVMTAAHLAPPKITWNDALKSLVPDSLTGPFTTNNVPAVLVLAVLVGASLRRMGRMQGESQAWYVTTKEALHRAMQLVITMMHFVLVLMPFAICASVAKAVGENGFSVFQGLAWYVVACISGMLLQIILVYQPWIAIGAKHKLTNFWRHARLPVSYAFGVNSSLATLPNTLEALRDMKVSDRSARLGACVGTNFNNDGILLYEVAAVLMLAQAAGLHWSISHQLAVAGMCIIAGLGVGGFPDAGLIALTLVLSTAGLPLEILPLLIPVDWLIGRMRSATNVIADMTVSVALERWPQTEGE